MKKEDYLRELALLLAEFPAQEREDALVYVSEYFDEAGDEEAVRLLGTPAEYASTLKQEMKDEMPPEIPVREEAYYRKEPVRKTNEWAAAGSDGSEKNKRLSVWIWILLILASPFIITLMLTALILVFAAAFTLLMLFLALCLVFGSFCLTFVLMIGKAFWLLFSDPLGTVFDLGFALISFCIAYFSWKLIVLIVKKVFPALAAWVSRSWMSFNRKVRTNRI